MLRGEKVGLRARHPDDVPILHRELHEDVPTRLRSDVRPWVPIPMPSSPYAPAPADDTFVGFSVVTLGDGALAGDALLWGIDSHNRFAHLGLSLLPRFRGLGLATDVVRVLCQYGFAVRGLQRLQLETLADNAPMLRAAAAAGFTVEGRLRRSAWVNGEFGDDVILGLLVEEWRGGPVTG